LADFLRKRRGDQTFAEFSRKLGLSSSTLQRMEMMQQNVTIDSLQTLVDRLGAQISDIFPEK